MVRGTLALSSRDGVALVLAPLTCGVVLLVSGVAKLRDATGTRDAFASMGVPAALRSTSVVRSLPFAEIALGPLLLVTWSWLLAVVAALRRRSFAAYWVLCSGCCGAARRSTAAASGRWATTASRGRRWRATPSWWRWVRLATAFGAAGSGLVPAVRDFRTTDWWWLLLTVAVAATAVLVVGRRPSRGPVADEDLLDYERVPIPFALLEDEVRLPHHAAAPRRRTPPAVVLPQLLTLRGVRDDRGPAVPLGPDLGPVEVSTVFTEPVDGLIAPRCDRTAISRCGSTSSAGRPKPSPARRPAAVLLGADGALAGGPVVGVRSSSAFRRGHPGRVGLRTRATGGAPLCRGTPVRPPEHISIREYATDGQAHGHDHGHGRHGHTRPSHDDDHGIA